MITVALGIIATIAILASCTRTDPEEEPCVAFISFDPHDNNDSSSLPIRNGDQTTPGYTVKNVAEEFQSMAAHSGSRGMFETLDQLLHHNLRYQEKMAEPFERDAEQILEEGFISGNDDLAIVAASILRASEIPCEYVMGAIPHSEFTTAFLLTELFYDEDGQIEYGLYDPSASLYCTGLTRSSLELPFNFVTIARGRDPWSMGIETLVDLRDCQPFFFSNSMEARSFDLSSPSIDYSCTFLGIPSPAK